MSHIKFRLEKFEKGLVFQVIEMDKRFRCSATDNSEFISSQLIVASSLCPDLTTSKIYLRGSDYLNDFKIATIMFDNNEERDIYHNKVIVSLTEWSNNYIEFRKQQDPVNDSYEHIYTL